VRLWSSRADERRTSEKASATNVLRVVRAGPFTTVQDLGRPGYAHLGVPPSGALDAPSLRHANRLVGNPDAAAVLEVTLGGLEVELARAAYVAVTGAALPVRGASYGGAARIDAGERVRLGMAGRGVRAYVAIDGGIDVDPVLGSRSTDVLSGLGPPVIGDGDVLPLGSPRHAGDRKRDSFDPTPLEDEIIAPLHPGPRSDWLTDDRLFATTWTVSPQSNRIGLRLAGPALERRDAELPSEGLVTGAVQLPTGGRPLIFLADHPTTGGYPVIGVVDEAALPLLAQARPGSQLRFTPSGWTRTPA
jgi:biotin-dependent carboxylase-like uncharacterized protein